MLSHTFNVSDPRVKDWLWMQSPIPTIVLCMLYFLSVVVGPKLMENRKPFDLKYILIAYNFSLVALSIYIIHQVSLSVSVCLCVYEAAVSLWLEHKFTDQRLQVQCPLLLFL